MATSTQIQNKLASTEFCFFKRYKAFFFISIIFLFSNAIHGQIYQKAIGDYKDETGRTIRQTTDNGFIICGTTYSLYHRDAELYLTKTDINGNIAWSKGFGGIDFDEGRGVCQTTDGGYAVIGSTRSFGAGNLDLYLLKVSAAGNLLWSTTIGGAAKDQGFIIEPTSDGGLILAGHTASYGAGNNDAYLIKTDVNGTVLWSKTFGNAGDDKAFSVVQTTDGGYALAGYTTSYGAGGSDVYLIRTDNNGNALWSKTFGSTHDDQAFSLKQTSDLGFILTGFAGFDNIGENNDIYVIKTDLNGALQWNHTYGGAFDDEGNIVCQTSDGGYVVFGFEASFGFGPNDASQIHDSFMLKLDGSGNFSFMKLYGGADDDYSFSGIQLSDGSYVHTGLTVSAGSGGSDLYLIKTDANGVSSTCDMNLTNIQTSFTTQTNSGYLQNNGFSSATPVTDVALPLDLITPICESLKVNLIQFSGTHGSYGNLLQWKTSMEENNNYFLIERSLNGVDFTRIGKVTGAGNKNHLSTYSFRDSLIGEEIYYYRLKQVDLDGTYSNSSIISITSTENKINKIFPNPSNGIISIQFNSNEAYYADIEVLEITGKSCGIFKGTPVVNSFIQELNLSNLSSGTYLLKIKYGSLSNDYFKIIIY